MQQEIEPAPALRDLVKERLQLRVVAHVQGPLNLGIQRPQQRFDVWSRLFIQPCAANRGTRLVHGACTRPCNALIIADTNNQALRALQHALSPPLPWPGRHRPVITNCKQWRPARGSERQKRSRNYASNRRFMRFTNAAGSFSAAPSASIA